MNSDINGKILSGAGNSKTYFHSFSEVGQSFFQSRIKTCSFSLICAPPGLVGPVRIYFLFAFSIVFFFLGGARSSSSVVTLRWWCGQSARYANAVFLQKRN